MSGPGLGTTIGLVTAAPAALAARVAVENESDVASSRLSIVIAGLIALAVVVTISTIVFWRATRPERPRRGDVGIRWIQPGEASSLAVPTTTAPVDASDPAPAPRSAPAPASSGEAPGADFGALSARPADG